MRRAAWLTLALTLAACATAPTPEPEPPPVPAPPTGDEVRIETTRWLTAIMTKVRSNWLRPADAPARFDCSIELDVTREGKVNSAKLRRSCGSEALDQSVLRAVWRSEPLPQPAIPDVFDPELVIHFVP